jgi:hypothetical protein
MVKRRGATTAIRHSSTWQQSSGNPAGSVGQRRLAVAQQRPDGEDQTWLHCGSAADRRSRPPALV